ncbi:MAG: RHS repeat-associated core domain-containing protein, partial [Treponema sp.]|nr:RHS repeat-associated core domain-containing protein [Treponema sp.]
MTDYGNDVYGVDRAWGYFETDNATTKVKQERHYRRTYVWDVRNRLTESHDSTNDVYYVYGEDGMRTNKYTREAETIYFSNFWTWHKDGGSELNGGKNSKHIFLGTERLVTKVNSANRPTDSEEMNSQYFYHSDHLGSAQLVTNHKGEVYQRIEYTPYGETWIDMRTNITALYDVPYRFTAKELDKETGLYYYGARYLDPKYSRWISTDPALGEYIPAAGKANAKDMANLPGMGGIFNHTNAGLFHYAGNNPVRYIDPDGRMYKNPFEKEFVCQVLGS